jgi:cytochrome c oxidase subunit 2
MLRARSGWKKWSGALSVALLGPMVHAQAALAQSADPERWQLNMGKGVTASSQNAYDAHMMALWICVAIGVIVFGAMFYAMFKFRHSKGAKPDVDFTHSTKLEIIWTVVPVVLLVAMAFPATSKLIAMYDTRDAAMTVKITGYQWLWKYEYMSEKPGEAVSFTSRLDRKSEEIRQSKIDAREGEHPHYLLDVDNALILPTDTKIRFVITADDVIHAWWVPALGWKQDAIPGLINEAWTEIKTPGVYRGQCAELCGKDHGFMPIVVKAVPKAEFERWIAAERAKNAPPAAPAEAAPAQTAPADAAPAQDASAPATAAADKNAPEAVANSAG